jgi:hypothetical protein
MHSPNVIKLPTATSTLCFLSCSLASLILHTVPNMSSQSDQQVIWTPPVITTTVYRVVMIIVSIAFIWIKYRRTARRIDGNLHHFLHQHYLCTSCTSMQGLDTPISSHYISLESNVFPKKNNSSASSSQHTTAPFTAANLGMKCREDLLPRTTTLLHLSIAPDHRTPHRDSPCPAILSHLHSAKSSRHTWKI